jgi:hypothetical protein
VTDATLKCTGWETISVTALAVAELDPDKYDGASMAHIQVLTQNLRQRHDDGDDPESAVGTQWAASSERWFTAHFDLLKMIAETGTAEVNVHYYKRP